MYNIEFSNAFDALNEINKPKKDVCQLALREDDSASNEQVQVSNDAITNAINLSLSDDSKLKGPLVNLVNSIIDKKEILVSNEENNDYKMIVNAAIKAARQFSSGPESKWPYQLQLLCNACISEKIAVDFITSNDDKIKYLLKNIIDWYCDLHPRKNSKVNTKNKKAMTKINQTFTVDNQNSKISTVSAALQNNRDENGQEIEDSHGEVYITNISDISNNPHDRCDIKISVQINSIKNGKTVTKEDTLYGEVKVVADNPNDFSGSHNADFVFIFGSKLGTNNQTNYPIWLAFKTKGRKATANNASDYTLINSNNSYNIDLATENAANTTDNKNMSKSIGDTRNFKIAATINNSVRKNSNTPFFWISRELVPFVVASTSAAVLKLK